MKLKEGLVLRKVAGQYIVVPTGRQSQISPVMQISSSAAWMWEELMQREFTEESLVEAVLDHFHGVTQEVAKKDVRSFLQLLEKNYMLDNGKPDPIMGSVKIRLSEAQARLLGKCK